MEISRDSLEYRGFFYVMKKNITAEKLLYAKVGMRYWSCSRKSIPESLAYKKVICKYVDELKIHSNKGTGLVLYGNYGSGKTGAGVIVLKAAIALGYSAMFLAARDIVDAKISKTIFDSETQEKVIDRAHRVSFLLLDDLGDEAETKSDFAPALMEGLVRRRSDQRLVTIITTNLNRDSISSRYGGGMVSILEGCTIPLHVSGYNWRRNEFNEHKNDLERDL